MIKKLFKRIVLHPWYFHLFNVFSAILSVMLFIAGRKLWAMIQDFGAELPGLTQLFIDNAFGLVALAIIAVGFSTYGYYLRSHGANLDNIKYKSFWLLLFTLLYSVFGIIAMYLPLGACCQSEVIG